MKESSAFHYLANPTDLYNGVTQYLLAHHGRIALAEAEKFVETQTQIEYSNEEESQLHPALLNAIEALIRESANETHISSSVYSSGRVYRLPLINHLSGMSVAMLDTLMKYVESIGLYIKIDDFEQTHVQILGAEDSFGSGAANQNMLPR